LKALTFKVSQLEGQLEMAMQRLRLRGITDGTLDEVGHGACMHI